MRCHESSLRLCWLGTSKLIKLPVHNVIDTLALNQGSVWSLVVMDVNVDHYVCRDSA